MNRRCNNIWVLNFEEAYGRLKAEKLLCDTSRHLFCVEAGDIYITGVPLSKGFVDYCLSIKDIDSSQIRIVEARFCNNKYSTCESIINDKEVLSALSKLARQGNFKLKPFYLSRGAVRLARRLNIPVNNNPDDNIDCKLIDKFNDKLFFRNLSKQLNIDTIPGVVAKGFNQVIGGIIEVCRNSSDRAIIKKCRLNGSQYKLFGTRDYLLANVREWMKDYQGEVIVEEFADIVEVCGSLTEASNEGVKFIGINSQIIDRCTWDGCVFPGEDSRHFDEIKEKSNKIGAVLQTYGGRGMLNIDWAMIDTPEGMKLCALESNFRYNGFEYVLDVAKSCFNINPLKTHLAYFKSFPISAETTDINVLLDNTRKIILDYEHLTTRIKKPEKGVVFTSNPYNKKISLIIAGQSSHYVKKAEKTLRMLL